MPSIKRMIWWFSPLVVIAILFYQFYDRPLPPEYVWERSVERALMRAEAEARDVLLLASAEQCPQCDRLKAETLADRQVARFLSERFVLLFLEAPEDRKEFLKSGLSIESAPTTFILTPQGRERARIEGFYPSEEYVAKIRAID